jgi:hypothetical protein
LRVVITWVCALCLGSCSVLDDSSRRDDQQLQQLLLGMDQCLSGQAQAAEQLRLQEQQLSQQGQQLQAVSDKLEQVNRQASSQPLPVAAPSTNCEAQVEAPEKLLVGELEQVWLQNLQLLLPARIDTGAETASLDARNIELFERNSQRWVRFEILHPQTAEPLPVERKLTRMVVILQSNSDQAERRPVIKMGITIGHISQTAEFTLSDRSHLDYQVLIGRNVLMDVMVVDVSQKHIAPVAPLSRSSPTTDKEPVEINPAVAEPVTDRVGQ